MNVDGYTQDACEARAAGIIVAGAFWHHCLRCELFLLARAVFKAVDCICFNRDGGMPIFDAVVPTYSMGRIRVIVRFHHGPLCHWCSCAIAHFLGDHHAFRCERLHG